MAYNISSYVDDLIPKHISDNYGDLVEFIKVYALFLESTKENDGVSGFYLNQLDHQRDIDLIETELLEDLQREIGVAIPRDFTVDPRLFYKHLIEFYRSRGTPNSIQAFFRLMHNSDVEIYYPGDDIISPSASTWVEQVSDIPSYTWTLPTLSVWQANTFTSHGADGFFNALAIEVLNYVTNQTPTDQDVYDFALEVLSNNLLQADVDEDGTVDIGDSIDILREVAGQPASSGTIEQNLLDIIEAAKADYVGSGKFSSFVIPIDRRTIDVADDNGLLFKGDDDVITVNGVITNATEKVVYNSSTEVNDRHIVFDTQLANGDVVKAYTRGFWSEDNSQRNSMPNTAKYIQDSYFYQKFSYVLRQGVNNLDWQDNFRRLVHPAGFVYFGEIFIFIKVLQFGIPVIQPGSQVGGLPFLIFVNVTDYAVPVASALNVVYKYLDYDPNVMTRFGAWDHFENTKFKNWRPIRDYRVYTIQDAINKRIGIHFGSQITIT